MNGTKLLIIINNANKYVSYWTEKATPKRAQSKIRRSILPLVLVIGI